MDLVHIFKNVSLEKEKKNSVHHLLIQGSFSLPVESLDKDQFELACNTLYNYCNNLVFVANVYDRQIVLNGIKIQLKNLKDPLKKIISAVSNPIVFHVNFCYNFLTTKDVSCETPSVEILQGKQTRGYHTVHMNWPLILPHGLDESSILESLCGGVNDFISYYIKSCIAVSEHFGQLMEVEPHLFLTNSGLLMVNYPKQIRKSHRDTESFLRSSIHQGLNLSMEFPQVRRNQSLLYRDPSAHQQLVSPHDYLSQPNSPGIVGCVRGRYTYKHYQQDGVEDKNWGCAYRSLQTIVSWYRWQGYIDCDDSPITVTALPTHLEIQKTLVRLRDKPAKFSGSHEWIGSFEVALCVREFCAGAEASIVHVTNGAAMADQARILLDHFRVHGTPVMIGGGVLAHTILGVYWDEPTGVVKFLILDPHYIGPDDIKTVIDKGWCCWKGVDFWIATESYNMCLPQRVKGL